MSLPSLSKVSPYRIPPATLMSPPKPRPQHTGLSLAAPYKTAVRFAGKNEQDSYAASDYSKTLVVMDYNGTISKDLEGVKKVLQAKRPSLIVMLNTGRSLPYIQSVRANFEGIPLDYLSTYNGAELYHNAHHEPSPSWIGALKPDCQIIKWMQAVERITNWSAAKVVEAIDKIVRPSFFESDEPVVRLTKSPTDPKYQLEAPAHVLESAGNALKDTVLSVLRGSNVKVHGQVEEKPSKDTHRPTKKYTFPPIGYSKVTPIEFILAEHPEITRIVTAGNDTNDTPMLKPRQFGEFGTVKNRALICGKKEPLRKDLQGESHCVYLEDQGLTLSEGLDQALEQGSVRA